LEELHIWSHVDDIIEIDATFSYLTLLLAEEDVHVVVIMTCMLLIIDAYMVHGGCQ